MPDRTIPTAASPGTYTGAQMADEIQDEIGGLWDRAVCRLTVTGGTGSRIEASCDPGLTEGVVDGMAFWLEPTTDNGGATTLAIDGESALDVTGADGEALARGALMAGRIYLLAANGGALRLAGNTASTGGGAINDHRIFDTGGDHVWTRPAGAGDDALVIVELIGGGGGGSSNGGAGGGGGGYVRREFRAGDLTDSVAITVAGAAGPDTSGNNSTFGTYATAYGGGKGGASSDWRRIPARGGAGGGAQRKGAAGDSREADGTGGGDATAGGVPTGGSDFGLDGYFGGGSGAPFSAENNNNAGGESAFGGGGGGADGIGAGGSSVLAGNGGAGRSSGQAPGGGGGGSILGPRQTGGGARGEVRVRTIG